MATVDLFSCPRSSAATWVASPARGVGLRFSLLNNHDQTLPVPQPACLESVILLIAPADMPFVVYRPCMPFSPFCPTVMAAG